MKRVLLIDGDTLIYAASATAEQKIDWGDDGEPSRHADIDTAIREFDGWLDKIVEYLGGTETIIALSDVRQNQWRNRVDPGYKANRDPAKDPLVRQQMKEYVQETQDTYLKPSLEGDDVLGILATHPRLVSGKKVVVSIDKDLKQIPGVHFNYLKADYSKPPVTQITRVTEEEGNHFHMMQALMGDPTDGYKGCPGIGPKKALGILEAVEVGGMDNGPAWWSAVVATYEKKGLTEEDALRNARVARICRHSDWDFAKKEVILWSPSN